MRNEKVKVLRALHTPGPKHVVRGQYGRGYVEGEEVPGYREEEGVAPDSLTETYVAAKLYVDNWRWADTPFYVRAGKRLARRETTIAIEFKRAPHPPFEIADEEGLRPNVLVCHIQPDEGVSLEFAAKVPGQGMTLRDGAHGLPLRRRPSAPGSPRPTSGCCSTASSATRRSSPARTRSRSSGRWWTRSSRSGSATGPRSRTTRPAPWGPAAADELMRRDGRTWRRH